jgi:hypothetical protein
MRTTGEDMGKVTVSAAPPCDAEGSASRHTWQTGLAHAPRQEAQALTVPPQRLQVIMRSWSVLEPPVPIPASRCLRPPDRGDRSAPDLGSPSVDSTVPGDLPIRRETHENVPGAA